MEELLEWMEYIEAVSYTHLDVYKRQNMSMDFRNVIFETEGLYNTSVIFNGQLLADNFIYVKGKR